MLCSMYLLSARNLTIEFRRQEVNIFIGTISKVMGRKLAGSDASPFDNNSNNNSNDFNDDYSHCFNS